MKTEESPPRIHEENTYESSILSQTTIKRENIRRMLPKKEEIFIIDDEKYDLQNSI